MLEFKLPAIGEGVVEGEIVRWLKQPGEAIDANEALVEVQTDKASVEVPSPAHGVVAELRAAEGDICSVGQVIALLTEGAAPKSGATSSSVPAKPASPSAGKVLATPAARALAREEGIDLSAIAGDRGRITKDDVVRAREGRVAAEATPRPTAERPEAARPEPAAPVARVARGAREPDETIPFRGIRRTIADGMRKAHLNTAPFTYVEQVDMTRMVEVRTQAKRAAEEEGVKLSYLPFIVKAVLHGLRKFPIVNAELDEDKGHIIVKKRYSIGIATATDRGLLVPVIHDADQLSLLDIAREVARLSEAARAGKARLEELTGSTFTITSLGAIGGVLATPIINYPEAAILGVHAIRKTPVVNDDDEIGIGYLMNLSITLDHRVVDGFEGAMFLQEVRRFLEDPTLLLLSGI